MQTGSASQHQQRGFTYVMVMAAVALVGLGLATLGPMWAESAQREHEQELLRVGTLYAEAIAAYRAQAPGSAKQYPHDLESLTLDNRFVGTKRHLRRLYADPLKPSRPWGLIRAADGGIRGVFSQDERAPLLRTGRDLGATVLMPATRYSDWKFVAKEQPQ
jgi:type II secretory pathway pseudopilin PulG